MTSDREQRRAALEGELGEPITLDGLTRDFTIFQRRRGHRYSTDDLLTAWYAANQVPRAARLLDLGSGIGSVGLAALWRLPPHATLVAIEAQEISFRLLRENVAANGVEARVTLRHGDLRETVVDTAAFELVTGSPPYFGAHEGIVPADSQKAYARFELRGDVRDYAAAARRALAPGGRFVFCFPTVQRARALKACDEAGLPLVSMRDVVPKAGLAALFTLFACRHPDDPSSPAPATVEPAHVVRDAAGVETVVHAAARATFGMGVGM